MLMSTSERFVEFGVMRTNGWTRRNILVLVVDRERGSWACSPARLGCVLAVAAVLVANRF